MVREENIRLIFGLKTRMLRQQMGMSLAELSKKTEISVSYLNEIEKGKKYPKGNKISSLAQALGTHYDWLVSLKLEKRLGPLSELLQSNILNELPLEVFGISPHGLLELMSDAPSKLNAFIKTLIEISRNYDLSVENFYFSVLRSFQEMHENYFEEIERLADRFREEELGNTQVHVDQLAAYLTTNCGYEIEETKLAASAELKIFRSVLKITDDHKVLYINPALTDTQKAFIFSREIGYELMDLEERSFTYSWVKVRSFDELLNNYKATYFAGSLLIPEQQVLEDCEYFLQLEKWQPKMFISLMDRHQASPEMYMHRLTSILPRYFGLNKLFFLRLHHKPASQSYKLTKELHLSGLHSPHGTVLSEHYCRRWVSLKIFDEIENNPETRNTPACMAQISKYIDTEKSYFCISIGRQVNPYPEANYSITIGLLMDDDFYQKVRFAKDANVKTEWVNETCERCSDMNCNVRAATPSVLIRHEKDKRIQQALRELLKVTN